MNNRFVCKQECFLGCNECDNATTCTQCSSGMQFSGNNCIPNTTYGESHGFCPLGTTKTSNNQCTNCSELNCASCDQSQCYECFDGYYANNGACSKCTAPCKTCVDNLICTRCEDGSFLPIISKSDGTTTYGRKCQPCHQNCLTCEDKARNCLSCDNNHRLNGTVCIGRYVVGVVYIFDFSFALFLQEGRIIDFMNFIMVLIGIDPTMIVINSLSGVQRE